MFHIINKIFFLLTKKERRQLLWLSVGITLMALIELVGIASIMPFLAVAANPEVVETNRWINWAFHIGNFESTDSFLIFLGFFVLFIIIASNFFKLTITWFTLKFVNARACNLSRRLFYDYLTKPYIFFLNQHSGLLAKNILQEVSNFIQKILSPTIDIFSRLILIIFILGLLFIVDFLLASIILIVLGGAYTILFFIERRKLTRLGNERFKANTQRTKILSDALSGIKDLKLLGKERVFFDKFTVNEIQIAKSWTYQQIISQVPRYFIEALSFGAIIIIVLYSMIKSDNLEQILPIIALYAFAGYRLMPALQNIFQSVTTLSANIAVLDALHNDIEGIIDIPPEWNYTAKTPLNFQKSISLQDVTFTYPNEIIPTINNFIFFIKKNSSVGIVGTTGSGKTTLVDIVLGLLIPQKGLLVIDDVPVTSENLSRWQCNLGYVPQHIFLCDDTVATNIAFGIPPAEIDMKAVERASKIANLHDFVVNDLPRGYLNEIGERGIRLSGGQRQRIGIARALYRNPEVLIMDEATSALDGITEEAVIQAIRNLSGKKTIITIAHRLTTLRDCDSIYIMEKGRIVDNGTYDELLTSSSRFRDMAKEKTVNGTEVLLPPCFGDK